MTCESCGREFKVLKSESRFDAFGRRVCRRACSPFPIVVEPEPDFGRLVSATGNRSILRFSR